MIIPLLAASLPLLLWPIEILFPYPHIVEEIAKGFLVFLVLRQPGRSKLIITFLIGFLFAFSESVLYLFNIYSFGNIETLILRFAITTPMHVLTSFLMLGFALVDKRLIALGLVLASLIHFFFNQFVANF